MATISSLGTGSGLDLSGMLTKLMAVEQLPVTQLQTKEATYTAKLTRRKPWHRQLLPA